MQAKIYRWSNGQRAGSTRSLHQTFAHSVFLSFVTFVSFCSKPSYFLQKETKVTKKECGKSDQVASMFSGKFLGSRMGFQNGARAFKPAIPDGQSRLKTLEEVLGRNPG